MIYSKGIQYSKGTRMICIEHTPILGKHPELYVGEGNKMLKVASFGSEEKAKMFEEWLQFFFGDNLCKEENEQHDA